MIEDNANPVREVYVVFDGPPGPESGRFVEVETELGESVATAAEWEVNGTFWRLGPFLVEVKEAAE